MATLITWCDEADAVLGDLTKEGSGVDFAVFSVELPKSKQEPARLVFSSEDHKGQGGRDAVQKCLETSPEDGIRMGCFLVSAIDQEVGATAVSVRSKFVHVLWMGDAVGVMVRGKVQSWYSAAVSQKLPQAAIFVQLKGTDDLDDLQVPALEASLSSAGGAHKPKRYSFTNSTAMGRDAAAMARAAEEAKRQAAEEAQRQAEEEARKKAEEARRKADEAQQKAEAERLAKWQADEEEAQRKAEEETRRQAEEEEEARKIAEEEARRLAAQDKKRRAEEEEARRLAEEEQRRRDEAERQRTKILITKNATLGEGRKLILLISKSSGNFQQTSNTSRLRIMMDGLGLPAEEIDLVDGGEESQKERRNTLFGISALRAQYPQVFLLEADGTTRFVGDFEEIQYLNESGTLGQTLGVTVKTTQKTVTITENVVVEEFVVESAADPTVVVEEEQVVVVETSTEVVTSQPMETLPSPEQPTTTEPASIKTEYQEAPQEQSKEGEGEGEAVPVQEEEEEERPLPVDAEPSGPVMESVTTTDIAVEKQQAEAECVAVVPPQAEQEQLPVEEPLPQDDSLQRTETADDRAEEEATEMGEANEQPQQQQQ